MKTFDEIKAAFRLIGEFERTMSELSHCLLGEEVHCEVTPRNLPPSTIIMTPADVIKILKARGSAQAERLAEADVFVKPYSLDQLK